MSSPDIYDVMTLTPKIGDPTKPAENVWVKLGVAFGRDEGDKGYTISLRLDTMPIRNWDGQLKLYPKKG